jgi:hypothetical protein
LSAATCSSWFLGRGFLYPEDGGDIFLRNVGSHRSTGTISQKTAFFKYFQSCGKETKSNAAAENDNIKIDIAETVLKSFRAMVSRTITDSNWQKNI